MPKFYLGSNSEEVHRADQTYGFHFRFTGKDVDDKTKCAID